MAEGRGQRAESDRLDAQVQENLKSLRFPELS